MDIAVCVKQIPNADNPARLDPDTFDLDRSGGLVLDEADIYSIEMALQLVEVSGGGEVTLVSMAPDSETTGLRTALALGAAKAVLVSDPALSGSDALSTAKVLAAVVRRLGADLVLCATESSDGYTGTMPVQLAELLDYPSVSFAKQVKIRDGVLEVRRQTEDGYDEVACPLPAVVTVTAGAVEPRYPTFKGIMGAKSKPIEELTLADIGIEPPVVGIAGARQRVVSLERAETRAAGQVITDEGSAEQDIMTQLAAWKVI